jgi:Tol biopolymer transport system component
MRLCITIVSVAAGMLIVGSSATLAAAPATSLVSVSTGGAHGNKSSGTGGVSVSGNGRYVAFVSSATNLVAGDTNGVADIFVRDTQTPSTRRVDVSTHGAQANCASDQPRISADGSVVVFASCATNIASVQPGCSTLESVYAHNMSSGVTVRISPCSAITVLGVSSDGRYILWARSGTACYYAIYRHEMTTGRTRLVASTSSTLCAGGGAMSADGNFIMYDLRSDAPPYQSQVYVREMKIGVTHLISRSSSGAVGNGSSTTGAISAHGRYRIFMSTSSNLVPGDTNGVADVFLHDTKTGVTRRVSVAAGGGQLGAASSPVGISSDGRMIAFTSASAHVVSGDTNRRPDLFVRDRARHTTIRVDVSTSGAQANGPLFATALAGDGLWAVFGSGATDFVANDTNQAPDVFERGPLA